MRVQCLVELFLECQLTLVYVSLYCSLVYLLGFFLEPQVSSNCL